jgi:hypothetical protein
MTEALKIAAFVASHDMPLVRVAGDAVEVSCEVVYADGALACSMPETVRSISEARDWLGY